MTDAKSLWAETFGTFWLVFGGCGSAVFAAAFPALGIGFAGVSLAFGLTVLTMAYAVGHISGGHFNPAVTVGLWAGGRFPQKDVLPYIPISSHKWWAQSLRHSCSIGYSRVNRVGNWVPESLPAMDMMPPHPVSSAWALPSWPKYC